MSCLVKARKPDLISLSEELGIDIPPNVKVPELIKLISEAKDFKEEFVKIRLEVIVAERQEKAKQMESEKEYELRKLEISSTKPEVSSVNSQETNVLKKQNLLKIMSRFDGSGDISVYLALFERQISRLDISKDNWIMFLQSLLPLEIVNFIAREPDPMANDYDHVKNLLLKRFKLSAEQFRQKFVSHRKEHLASWRDFGFEIRNYFEEWIKGLEVSNFEDLKELIITEQIKRKLPLEMSEHFIDDLSKIKKIDILVNKLDEYEAARRNFRKGTNRSSNNFESVGKKPQVPESEHSKTSFRYQNTSKPKVRQYDSNYGMKNRYKSNIKCFSCGLQGHVASQCQEKNISKDESFNRSSQFSSKKEANFSSNVSNKLCNPNNMGKNIEILGKKIKLLFDTGSDLTLMSYETYVNIGSPKLYFDSTSLSGISNETVYPLGYFPFELCIDNVFVSANIYVLKQLSHELVLGTDVINKLNLSISEKGIQVLSKRDNFQIGLIKIIKCSQNENEMSSFEKKKVFRRNNFTIQTSASCTGATTSLFHDSNESRGEEIGKENNFLINLADAVNLSEIDLCHVISPEHKQKIMELIDSYKPLKTKSTELKMNIILTDDIPINERPRRFPFKEQKIIEDQIQEWLRDGIIRPSCSDYAAPIVLCRKKDNSYRLCIDYRKINRKTVKDHYPLPLIEEVLDRLENSKVFTTLDLKNAFFHVEINEKSKKYTAFVTHDSEYEFNKCPFGLSNSPSQFQRYINNVFRELLRDGTVIIYMDDIIIPSQSEEEGIEKLKRVLKVASDYGLEFNFKKCQFLKRKIEFLGYVVEDGTVQPSPTKTLAVRNFPVPKSVKQVQSYLGLTGYFRKFIPYYSLIAKPLSDLLRNDSSFEFGPAQVNAFNKLKEILSQKPVLHIFKQGSTLELHTDASIHGFGAVLLQRDDNGKFHPIHYMSKKTTPQQEKYNSYELEVLAIIEALKKFRHYLLGPKFKIITDCAAFQKTIDKKDLTPKIARWAIFLEEFDYEIKHRAGNRMKHVDALSRNTILVVTRSHDELTSKIAAAQKEDEHIKIIKALVEKGEENAYFIKNNILYKFEDGKELLVIPDEMQIDIVRKIHNKGHFAVTKTEELIKQEFYIPKLRKLVETVISNCIDCILHNKKRGKAEGFLNPIPKENVPLSTYHIDHIGPLPSTNKRYQHILSVVDAFTKFTWFYPVKSTSAQEVIEKLKLQQTVFGNPSRIISDKGPAFTSNDLEEYCASQGIVHSEITTGVPRGNGQIERIHNILIPVLSKLSKDDSTKWYKYVPEVQRIINSTITRSTKFSPFELMIGIKMKNKEDLRIKEILEDEYISCMKKEREDMREEARKNILKIQEENKKQYDRKRKSPKKYKVDDLVAIQRTQYGTGLKLREKYHGPYKIIAVKPNDRYEVQKIGIHEGPIKTSSAAEYMKPWSKDASH